MKKWWYYAKIGGQQVINKINLEKLTKFSLNVVINVVVAILVLGIYHINTQRPNIVKADLTLIAKNYVDRELKAKEIKEEDLRSRYLNFMQVANNTIRQIATEKHWIILLHESTLGGVIDVTPYVAQAIINNLSPQ